MRSCIPLLGLALIASGVSSAAFQEPTRTSAGSRATQLYFGLPGSDDFLEGSVSVSVETDGWSLHSRLPASLMDNAAVATETHVYALPGYSLSGNPRTFTRLANGAVTWETLAEPPLEISNGGAAIIGDTIYYATGFSYGMNPPRTLDTLLKYSISGGGWTVAPGPHGTGMKYNWQPLVLAAAGRLYYISGCREPGSDWPTRQVWAYTPGAGWVRVADMNQGRVFAAGWVYRDTIWVAGGLHSDDGVLNHTEFYCPVTDEWKVDNSLFPRLPERVWAATGGIVGSTAFIAGGADHLGQLYDRVTQFDHGTRTWSVTGSLILPVYRGAGTGSADGKALVIGGSTGGFTPTDTVQYEQVAPGPGSDVGVSAILAPAGAIPSGSVTPRVRIRNYGTDPQSAIPVRLVIDLAGTPVYSANLNHPGPLGPGASAEVSFTPAWNATEGSFGVTSWTALAGDENPANDTMQGTVTVASSAWETIPKPPDAPDRIVHVTVYDPGTDRVYMLGGNPEGYRNTYDGLNRYYDPATSTWMNQAPMPIPLGWCGYGLVDGRIYIIGGHDNRTDPVALNQQFDIATNSWSAKTGRPGRPTFAPISATWRDRLIYVMGGIEAFRNTNRVDIYNPAHDAWAVGTSLPRIGYMGSAAVVGDTIYIAQAYDGEGCWPNLYKGAINPSNPTQITWLAGPPLPERVFNGATVAVNGEVYWLGGFVPGEGAVNRIWKYSPATGEITRFAPDYPDRVARITFAAAREAADGWEIYGMAGDKDGDWDLPNQTYVRLNMPSVGIEEESAAPRSAVIESVRPGVARDRVTLEYSLGRAGRVRLDVYDAAGRLVRSLVSGPGDAGRHSVAWHLDDTRGRRVPAGTYFYRLAAGGSASSARSVVTTR